MELSLTTKVVGEPLSAGMVVVLSSPPPFCRRTGPARAAVKPIADMSNTFERCIVASWNDLV